MDEENEAGGGGVCLDDAERKIRIYLMLTLKLDFWPFLRPHKNIMFSDCTRLVRNDSRGMHSTHGSLSTHCNGFYF